jgi:mannose-1-phosphate guanylyltransferase
VTLYALILAGGSGTRLWPRSRSKQPKQFLDLTGDHTMLQEAALRLDPLVPLERIFVATNRQYTGVVTEQLPGVPPEQILGEPQGKGTAAAIGLAAVHLRRLDPDAVMSVFTADHLIANRELLRRAVAAAVEVARLGWLVTLGIKPTYAERGYGYIKQGEQLPRADGLEVHVVERFEEKPSQERAEEFVSSGEYAWNSGMFVWTVQRILGEIERHMPALYASLVEIEQAIGAPDEEERFMSAWSRIEPETIDYGVMEKADHVAVLPVDIGWSDVGSWSAVYDVMPHDESENAVVGEVITIETTGSLIYSPHRIIATVGVEDMIVVDTGDVILICPRSRSQDVRRLVEAVRERGLHRYLDE